MDGADQQRFLQEWNALARRDRLRLRRLVRLGRPMADATEARLAVAYGQYQRSRIWARMFWLWFVPGIVMALGVAIRIHPIVVGVVLALAAQAVFARRNLGRIERVNADVLGSPPHSST
jgi:hypothetical protein